MHKSQVLCIFNILTKWNNLENGLSRENFKYKWHFPIHYARLHTGSGVLHCWWKESSSSIGQDSWAPSLDWTEHNFQIYIGVLFMDDDNDFLEMRPKWLYKQVNIFGHYNPCTPHCPNVLQLPKNNQMKSKQCEKRWLIFENTDLSTLLRQFHVTSPKTKMTPARPLLPGWYHWNDQVILDTLWQ